MTEPDEEPIYKTMTISYCSQGQWHTIKTQEEFDNWVAGKLL